MKKYAAIDVGTNSMRLLLASTQNGKIISKEKHINPTRIGESVDKARQISEEGIIRNIKALHDFSQKSKEYGAIKTFAIATSAVRDALNGEEFIKRAYEETGVNIELISGEEEAALGYKGVVMGIKDTMEDRGYSSDEMPKDQRHLVIDIGGGSTELILGQDNTLCRVVSLNVGAVRMTERHITTNPVSREEYKLMKEDILKISAEAAEDIIQNNLQNIIGIGGTITTLAALHQELDPYNPDKVHNYTLTLGQIIELKERLLKLTTDEIKNLKGIHPKRADIIIAGITILYTIMNSLGAKDITVSEYDNLEGLFYQRDLI